ncbi:NADH-quinone oxidoreductase subunit NuoH [Planctomicrobium sp. SH664]|uniref:NADH-quinone oxidoreductase subunit NuoH n=1 Tax=Planctomicrobium sp. SH664 TaxID=3448125 RepID=UPI003F5AF169
MQSLLLASMTSWISQRLGDSPSWLPSLIVAIVHTALVGAFFGLPALVFIWAERKVAGRIQDRLGPTRVGGRFGWLQSLADGIKLIQKEDLAPQAADQFLFRISPYIVVVAAFAAFIFIPFSDGWASVAADTGLFVALAVLSLEVLGIVLAGYSSASKWSLFGGMREAAQMVSYEVPLGLTAVVPVVVAGTMNLGEIVSIQSGWFTNWLVFHNVFTFLAFFVFFTVTLASNKRAPFDLAEAESELVGGFHTEYSGMRWSFFFLAEYAAMFFVSMLGVLLFLGGWWTGIAPIDQALVALNDTSPAMAYLSRVIGMVILLKKASLLVFVQIWIRWTLPRLRIDQVMTTCLKYLVPISCFLFLGAVIWPLVLASTVQRTTLFAFFEPTGERVPAARPHEVIAKTPVETRVETSAEQHAAPQGGH